MDADRRDEPWAVPLDTDEPVAGISYEAAALPEREKQDGRPRWMVPAGIAALVVLLVGTAYGINRHNGVSAAPATVAALASTGAFRTPDTAAIPSSAVSDSAAGTIAQPLLADSAVFTAIRDSIVQADAERRAARQAKLATDEAAARLRAASTVTDSTGQKWSTVPPPSIDSAARAAKKDSVKKDTTVKVRPDTLVRPDTGSFRRR